MSELPVTVRRISDESFVSGEGVKLDLNPASPFMRTGAFLMDLTLYAGTFLILMFAVVRYDIVYGLPSTLNRSLTVFLIFFSFVLLPFLIEAFTRGYSLGKWAFNI